LSDRANRLLEDNAGRQVLRLHPLQLLPRLRLLRGEGGTVAGSEIPMNVLAEAEAKAELTMRLIHAAEGKRKDERSQARNLHDGILDNDDGQDNDLRGERGGDLAGQGE
jgi:hypothetical protein